MPDLKNKRIQQLLYFLFIIGVALLLFAKTDIKPEKEQIPPQETQTENDTNDLERKLEKTLRMAEGVGDVKVIISYKNTPTKVIAKDKTEEVAETSKRFQENVVLNGNNEPVILRENQREVQGVVIVASGGDDINVKNKLISSAVAFLGVDSHRIEVLKMKS